MEWIFFPKTCQVPKFLKDTVSAVEAVSDEIDSGANDDETRLASDEVLGILEPGLSDLGYKVERSKKKIDKVRIPVLYGSLGKEELAFEADAYHEKYQTVIEVEAGRAVTNYQFLKDIFQASMMVETEYLILAVRILYREHSDYETVRKFIETVYLTDKVKLDLKGILLVGY